MQIKTRRRSRQEETKVWRVVPRYLLPLPFDVFMCDEVGSELHALIKKLAIRWVKNRSETYSNEFQHLVEGRKYYVFGGDSLLSYSKLFHSARVTISADRGWRLRASDSCIRKAPCLYTHIVPRG